MRAHAGRSFARRGAGYAEGMASPTGPQRENFGEASLGEAQSSNPPKDPEMIREGDEAELDPQTERQPGEEVDPDAGPAYSEKQADLDAERDQAEG
jgi:hypothetical protein